LPDREEPTRRQTDELSIELHPVLVERIADVHEFQHLATALESLKKRNEGLRAMEVYRKRTLRHVLGRAAIGFTSGRSQDGTQCVVPDGSEVLFRQWRCSHLGFRERMDTKVDA